MDLSLESSTEDGRKADLSVLHRTERHSPSRSGNGDLMAGGGGGGAGHRLLSVEDEPGWPPPVVAAQSCGATRFLYLLS